MKRLLGIMVAFGALGGLGPQVAEGQGLAFPKIENAATLKECGACHMVYSPQMLPQRAWDAIMSGLDSHYGETATVDEATRLEILNYLLANAADSPDHKKYAFLLRGVKASVLPARVTEMPWFLGSHGEVNIRNLKATRIKSASNCIACHVGADTSMVFSEPD